MKPEALGLGAAGCQKEDLAPFQALAPATLLTLRSPLPRRQPSCSLGPGRAFGGVVVMWWEQDLVLLVAASCWVNLL